MNICPLSDALGAEVTGLDLRRDMHDEIRGRLREAFLERHLLCFRSAPLEAAQFAGVARVFGTPQAQLIRAKRVAGAPEVSLLDSTYRTAQDKPDDLRLARLSGWHTDDSYFERPAKATGLQALAIPSSGGQTRFCNTRRAFEDLAADIKVRLRACKAVHAYDTRRTPASAERLSDAEASETRDVVHPLVRRHDDDGRESLYYNANRTDRIVGMARDESDALLDFVEAQVTREQYRYTHRWEVGDLLLWDNRCLVHSVNMDFPVGERRLHQRILLEGPRPQ